MGKLSRILAERAGSTIVLLAHGGVNRVILFDALKLDLVHLTRMDQSYGCINIIDYYESGPVVKLVNG
jgi:alpha-ribazole phosphatase/probable phosphoglycerate mutase